MDGLFKGFLANQASGIFLRQIGPGILGPGKLGPGKLGPSKLGTRKFLFCELGPKNHFAANWAQKNFVQQIYNTDWEAQQLWRTEFSLCLVGGIYAQWIS